MSNDGPSWYCTTCGCYHTGHAPPTCPGGSGTAVESSGYLDTDGMGLDSIELRTDDASSASSSGISIPNSSSNATVKECPVCQGHSTQERELDCGRCENLGWVVDVTTFSPQDEDENV